MRWSASPRCPRAGWPRSPPERRATSATRSAHEAAAAVDELRRRIDAARRAPPRVPDVPGPAPLRHRRHREHLRRRGAGPGRGPGRRRRHRGHPRAPRSRCSTTCPHGATTEGYGGTYATQENFRIMREALDAESRRLKRYIQLTNYSSGLCMAEIAFAAAWERLDMLLNDAMYGILFRDINMRRTFIDQYFSRRICALRRHHHQHRRGQLHHHRRRLRRGAHRDRQPVHQRGLRQARRAPGLAAGPRTQLRDRSAPARDAAPRAEPGDAGAPLLPRCAAQVHAADQAQGDATSSSATPTT